MRPGKGHAAAPDLRDAVESALYEYAAAADARDAAAIGRMFAAARVSFGGQVVRGAQHVEAMYRRPLESAPATRHLLANVRIRSSDPGEVDAVCTYVRLGWDPAPEVLSVGDYIAHCRVLPGGRVQFTDFAVMTHWSR